MHSNPPSAADPDTGETAHFGDFLGMQARESPDGSSCLYLPIGLQLRNRSDMVHGGVIMTLMDTAGAWAGRQPGELSPKAVTVSLHCSFLRAAKISATDGLRAQAKVVKSGRSLYFSSIEVFSEPAEELVATAQGVYGRSKPPDLAA